MLTWLAKLLRILNSDTEPKFIALAITLGMVAGLNPTMGLMTALVVLGVLCLRVHLATFFAFYALFSLLATLTATLLSSVGEVLLSHAALESFWTELYQTYWFRLFHYNNSLTLGAAVSAVLLIVPIFILSRSLVIRYRVDLMAFVNKFQIVRTLKASKFYKIYEAAQQD